MKVIATIAALLLLFAAPLALSAQTDSDLHDLNPQCTATTKAGAQCKRSAAAGATTCHQHNPTAPKCGQPTKAGGACKRTTKGGPCHQHGGANKSTSTTTNTKK